MHLEEGCRRKRIKLINRGKCVKLIEITVVKIIKNNLAEKENFFWQCFIEWGRGGGILNR